MRWVIFRRRRRRASSVTKHYQAHKEAARALVHARLEYWNQFYGFQYTRVAIRNQRRCWGSCSSHGNLNFSYKLLFLPPHLRDYIIVHELCHLKELNHSARFWALVEEQLPERKRYQAELRQLERTLGTSARALEQHQRWYGVECSYETSDRQGNGGSA